MISNPFANPMLTLLTDPWQKLIQQNLATWGEASTQTVKSALEQFQAGQAQAAQLTKLVTQAWAEIGAQAPAAEWPVLLNAYLAQLRQQLTLLAEKTPSPQQAQDFWQLYGQLAQKASQPWLAFWQQIPSWFAPLSTTATAPWQSANQAFGEIVNQSWNQLLGMPALGLNRQLQEKMNRWTTLTLENQQAWREYQLLLGNAWLDAIGALLQKLMGLAQVGKSLENSRQLLDLWVEVADARFLDLFHSSAYATAQATLVNSNMALRQQQRELLEIWLRQHDLPTRSDLDEAHRSIYELRKEVKALKKQLTALERPSASPGPVVSTNGRRKRRTNPENPT